MLGAFTGLGKLQGELRERCMLGEGKIGKLCTSLCVRVCFTTGKTIHI